MSGARHSIFPLNSQVNRRRFQSNPQHPTLVHSQGKPLEGSHCPKTSSGSSRRKVHSRNSRKGLLDLECSECHRKCATPWLLKRHAIQHTRTSDHMCPPAPSQLALKNHMTRHTGRKSFQCTLCPKVFGLKEALKGHLRVHAAKVRRYKCPFCDYAARVKAGLASHLVNHRNERKFKCPFCNHGFNHYFGLVEHIRSHTKEKPFQCHVCQMRFTYSQTCKRHVASIHEGVRFKCDLCGKELKAKCALERHYAVHTTPPGSCEFCVHRRKFPRKCELNSHRRIHIGRKIWECGPCNSTFNLVAKLRCHHNTASCQRKRKAEMLTRQVRIVLQRI